MGMIGVGYCYNQYASGAVDSDDDVAVMLDSETLEALSVPLISMNYVFTNAVCENVISEDEKEELIQIAKSTFYPKRNYAQTLSKSSLNDEAKENLIDFIRTSDNIKKEDAKELLKHIKKYIENENLI